VSRSQRRRQEKWLERAEAVMDKTEKKVERNAGKGKVVKERKASLLSSSGWWGVRAN